MISIYFTNLFRFILTVPLENNRSYGHPTIDGEGYVLMKGGILSFPTCCDRLPSFFSVSLEGSPQFSYL